MTPIERTHRPTVDKPRMPIADAMAARREVGGDVHAQDALGTMVYIAQDLHAKGVEREGEDGEFHGFVPVICSVEATNAASVQLQYAVFV